MRRASLILATLLLPSAAAADGGALRILSLDYCADAYALAFAEEGEIAALSPDALAPYAWGREQASGLPRHRGDIEDILSFRPTLVLKAGSGHARLEDFLARFGIATIELGYAESLDDARAATRLVGARLGRTEKAEAILGDLDRRLGAVARRVAALDRVHPGPSAVYLTPSGVTSGFGTYIDEAMRLAGIDNLLGQAGISGFTRLDPERMAVLAPDLMIASFFAGRAGFREDWRFSLHAVTRRAVAQSRRHDVPAASWGCAGFFLIDAIESLVDAREAWQSDLQRLPPGRAAQQ